MTSSLPPSYCSTIPEFSKASLCVQSYLFRMFKAEGAPAHGAVAHLLPQTYKRYVSEWLEEDTPSFDYGGFVVGEEMSEAKLLGKSEVSTY
jgi:hypothetical protein